MSPPRWYMANLNWWGTTVSTRDSRGVDRITKRYPGTLGSGSPVAFTVP